MIASNHCWLASIASNEYLLANIACEQWLLRNHDLLAIIARNHSLLAMVDGNQLLLRNNVGEAHHCYQPLFAGNQMDSNKCLQAMIASQSCGRSPHCWPTNN